jgi:type II secretory pathway component PulF
MPRFRFIAVTATNERRIGSRDAVLAADLVRELTTSGHTVIRIEPDRPRSSLWQWLNADISLRPPISAKELALLTQEWASLIESGVTVEETLLLSCAGAKRKRAGKIVEAVRQDIKAGAALHDTLRKHPACFPQAYVAMVQAAEAAGNLGPVLRRLALDLDARQQFADKIRSALLYPAFLVVTAGAVIVTLLIFVVPSLESLLRERDTALLPITTQVVLGASKLLRLYGTQALAMAIFALVIVAAALRIPKLQYVLDLVCLRSPMLGDLVHAAQSGRFLRVLSSLLAGGVALPHALRLASQAITNNAARRQIEEVGRRVHVGVSVGDAFAQLNSVPAEALALTRIGERAGRLAEVMGQAATLLETKTRRRLETIVTLVGPCVTVAFGLVAGLIVYAMLSTILSLNELAAQ